MRRQAPLVCHVHVVLVPGCGFHILHIVQKLRDDAHGDYQRDENIMATSRQKVLIDENRIEVVRK